MSALCAGSWLRLGCSRLAANRIGAAGVEALARKLPPSLTTLKFSSMFGLGRSAVALGLGMRCAAGRICCTLLFSNLAAAYRLGREPVYARALFVGS